MRLNKHMTVKEHAQHTIGVEFSSRTLKLGEKKIKLQVFAFVSQTDNKLTSSKLWDTAGQERFRYTALSLCAAFHTDPFPQISNKKLL